MKRIFAIIGALLTGGLSVALTSASQAALAATNATNMTNMSSMTSDMMTGSISALATN